MEKKNSDLLTPDEARAWLIEHGTTHKMVAQSLGVNMETVRDVLYGVNKGNRGQGHKVAVALRIKAPPTGSPPPMIPSPPTSPEAEPKQAPRRRKTDREQAVGGAA